MEDVGARLCAHAIEAASVREWREGALAILGEAVRFERALFHELSPRASFEGAAVVGLERERVAVTMSDWDGLAVELGALRDTALAQGGVAIDQEAFRTARARARWRRVMKPLGIASALAAHVVFEGRIIAVALLGRRRNPPFSSAERVALTPLLPVLAVCEVLLRRRGADGVPGLPTRLRCLDQRLTERQRQVVEHVALGQTNADIGEALGISPNTVRNLLVDVRRRLGAANRAEVVRLAVLR